MKRILSLTLALVMVLGTFTGVFAAEQTAEEFAVDFLVKNDILKGAAEDGDLMLEKGLARRDAVVLLSRLLGEEEVAADFPVSEESPTWNDARTDAYYIPFFSWAETNGYFEGDDENNFNPREEITGQEYVLVLQRALGYEDAYGHDAWKAALETGKELGLLEDLELEDKEVITRGQMAVMTFNALGAELADGSQTLAEFLGIEMPEEPKAKDLEVVEVYTENLAEVVVELSNADLVKNKEALSNPANYRLTGERKVFNVDLDGDNVILTLVPYGRIDEIEESATPLVKGKKYDLTIRNIDPAINKTYKGVEAVDNEIPYVVNVDFMGTHGIKVTTSEPIDNPQERNFRIGDRRTSMYIEQYGRELILTPYHNASFDKEATELVVEGLADFAQYRSVKTFEKMELATDTTAPEVVEAYRSGDKLTLVFDQDVYYPSIKKNETRRELGNVSFIERRVTFYAEEADKVDTNKVVYRLEREIPKDAEITVEGVQNHSRETMEKDVVVPVLFNDEYAPIVISDLSTSIRTTGTEGKGDVLESATGGLTVVFDKHIAEFKDLTKAELEERIEDFFSLYILDVSRRNDITDKVEIKVVEVKDDRVKLDFVNKGTNGELRVNNSYRDYDYVLEVKNLRDTAGNRMVREYIDFQILPKSTAFNVTKIELKEEGRFNRKDVEIVLSFSSAVDKVSAEEATNYYLDGKLAVDEAIVERDGKTVTLVLFDTTEGEFDYEVLEISPRVKNLAKNATVANRFWNLVEKEAITDPVSEKEAFNKVVKLINELPAVDKIELKDKAAVNEAKAAYEALTNEQKALLTDELAILEAAENAIIALETDEDAAVATAKNELNLVIADAEEEEDRTIELDQAILDAKKVSAKTNVTLKELKDAKLALEEVLENFRKDVAVDELTDLLEEIVNEYSDSVTNWMTLSDLEVEGTLVTADFNNAVKTDIKGIYDSLNIDADGKVEGADGSKKDAVEFAVDSYVMNTFARYIAELNDDVKEIVYNGKTYTWDTSIGSTSKWTNEDGKTLVSEVVNNSDNRGIRTVSLTIVDEDGYSINITFEAINVHYNYVF